MGHTRLGTIPKLRKWDDVVALFATELPSAAASDVVGDVARLTLVAAEPALRKVVIDPGMRAAFLLLARTVLAAREPDLPSALASVGIKLAADASLFDLTSQMHGAIDDVTAGRATDVSEMAQRALGEAVTELASPRAHTLFGTSPDDLKSSLRELSTKKGFAELGQRFFGHFLARFLNSYLSRVAAAELGVGVARQVGDLSKFNAQLRHHCVESAAVLRDFCGEWYSKTNYREGINEDNAGRFIAVAVNKLAAELMRQRA